MQKYDDTVIQVGDNEELLLAHQDKNTLAGNMGHLMGYLKMSSTPVVRLGL